MPDGNTWLIYDEKKLPDGWSTEAWKGMYSVLDLVMILVLILPGMSILIVNVLAGIAIIVMLSSLALYLKMYWKVWKSIAGGNQKRK